LAHRGVTEGLYIGIGSDNIPISSSVHYDG
jgi:hypothetical protein